MDLLRYISISIIMFFEFAVLLVRLYENNDKQFRKKGMIIFTVFLIPLLYMIIK